MMVAVRIVGAGFACVWLALAPSAAAQEGAYQLEQFEPRPPGAGLLGVSTPADLPAFGYGLDVWTHYSVDPLVLTPTDGDDPRGDGAVVADRLRMELAFAFGLLDGLQVGLAAPFARSFSAGEHGFAGRDASDFETWAPGDVRIHLDVAPLRVLLGLESFVGLSVGASLTVWMPTGDEAALEGEGAVRYEPRVTARYAALGVLRVAADLGYHARPDARLFSFGVDDALRWGVAADLSLPLALGVSATVFGAFSLAEQRDPDDLERTIDGHGRDPAEAQLAVRFAPTDIVTVRVGAGAALTEGVGAPTWRALAQIGFQVPGPAEVERRGAVRVGDADADGVDDEADVCPHEPENVDGVRDADGCPEAPASLSGEAAPEDQPTPSARHERRGAVAALSRPADTDADGLDDDVDACPDVKEDPDGFEDDDGCPDLDDDGDGVADALDECPRRAEIFNGVEDDDGCPDIGADADGDGVEDRVDVCPLEPEDEDGVRDGDGCPDEALLLVAGAVVPASAAPTPPAGRPASPPIPPPTSLPPLPLAADVDGDGVPAETDACPEAAEDKDGFEDHDGCPDPDDDGDGVLDAVDRCPRVAENINGVDDLDGCPETGPDADGDGVGDFHDLCPDDAEDRDGDRDWDGCPDGVPVASAKAPARARALAPLPLADLDGDGLAGDDDRCPREAEDEDGFEDWDGCPDPDDDGDGVPDAQDRCPRVAETNNGHLDEDGCPDVAPRRRRGRAARPMTEREPR